MAEKSDFMEDANSERSRISRLASACVRISASLDPETVLNEAVSAARELTHARFGFLVTTDEFGRSDYMATSGITADGLKQIMEWSDGVRLFDHMREISGPLRVKDVHSYVEALGISSHLLPKGPFQGAPIFSRDKHLGNFFLASKEGRLEFTEEDEEILLLFAAQAATAIANARAYHDEQRARADLEAIIETTLIGVVVFDARSGKPVSVNREIRRIVDNLLPGRTPDEILKTLKCRRGDGTEISLDKISLAEVLSRSETISSEELVLWIPEGNSVSVLINITPIRNSADTIESVVVTAQDLAPLQEIEHMRTEFVGTVSHELRAPLTSIKGSVTELLDSSATLDRAEMREYFRIIVEQANLMTSLIRDLLDAGRIETGTLSVDPTPESVRHLVEQVRNTFISGEKQHEIVVDMPSNLPQIHAECRRIEQVLNNLLSNASRHSPTSSPIRIKAVLEDTHVAISVADEGQGLEPEQLRRIFQKYTATGLNKSEHSGLGLAICKGIVEAHGGRIWAESGGKGYGSKFTFTIPTTISNGMPAKAAAPDPDGDGTVPPCILVVDDDPRALRFIRNSLVSSGYKAVVTGNYLDLPELIEKHSPQLILLDLVLPGIDGIELMKRMPELAVVPVIFVSAYGRDETVAEALESGAADYIVKPFSPTELTARIRAALRKRREPVSLNLGELTIHFDHRQAELAGQFLDLTLTEFELLRLLAVNSGRILSYDFLMKQIWGSRNNDDRRRVRTFIKKLRQKIDPNKTHPLLIENVRGVGYRMAQPKES